MNRILNEHELDYVFQHLELVTDTSILRDISIYGGSEEVKERIIFRAHEGSLSVIERKGTPILFGSSDHPHIYSVDDNGNLIFHHDLLKSAFYLLSGYHELFENKERDHWGRIKYDGSIQKQLGIIHRPLVNEYFDLIFRGINSFLKMHDRPILKKRKLFDSFGFLLSHDIDVIDKYGWSHLGYKIKELIGLAKTNQPKWRILKATIQSAIQFINPKRSNPYWNFDFLSSLESENHFKASYYFLSHNLKGGSKYHFDEPRLISLFDQLKEHNHEIGIHGTTSTSTNEDILKKEIDELEKAAETIIHGGRQHRLWLTIPKTFEIHESAGLKYDSSFGFAEQEGFRNSFCLPFKPYDFEKQRTIDCWQFPLMAMDVTLFSYRQLKSDEVIKHIELLVSQVAKHNGIFTLLWHNSFFDETLYPGVKKTYKSILDMMSKNQAEGITGKQLTEKLMDR